MKPNRCQLFGAIVALAIVLPGMPAAAHHAEGFIDSDVDRPDGNDWAEAVGVGFQDNGRTWVWERGGTVWIIDPDDPVSTPFIDISEEVGAWGDHGLLGLAVDPNFVSNGYVYLLYVVDRHHLLRCAEPASGMGAPICDGAYDPTLDITNEATIGRLVRYQAEMPTGESDYAKATTALLSSRKVLIGETISTGIPSTSISHVTGSLIFGTDRTLLVSTGDGARSNNDAGSTISTGNNTYSVQALADGIIDSDEDVGANRAQMLDSLNGKILRLDPDTGDGVSSNPYYDGASPRSARSRVWALGFRNPYRMSLRPNTGDHDPLVGEPGELILGDVGRNAWEEINVVERPGQNFGWPIFEGMELFPTSQFARGQVDNAGAPNPLYDGSTCTAEFFQFDELIVQDTLNVPSFPNPCDSGTEIPTSTPTHVHSRPILAWSHTSNETRTPGYNGSGNAITWRISDPSSPIQGTEFTGDTVVGGVIYSGTDFPPEYQGDYFFGDFTDQWIRRLEFDAAGNPVAVHDFSDEVGGVVDIASSPTMGGLYYISWTLFVKRLDYAPGGNFLPEPVISANPVSGPSPLTVQFDASGSTDDDGDPLTFSWDFGDGGSSTATAPMHTYTAPISGPVSYTATLTADDGTSAESTSIIISPNNSAPIVEIVSPADGTNYPRDADTTYDLIANIDDEQSNLSCEWLVALHHNEHNHRNPPIMGCDGKQAILHDEGCDGDTYFYRVTLTVTDPFGLTTTDSVDLPQADCAGGPLDPVANGDTASISIGGSQTIDVLDNDFDDTGLNPASVQIETSPVGLSVTGIDSGSGAISVSHDGATGGPIVFSYSVEDDTGVRSNAGTVVVTLPAASNTPPAVAVTAPANGSIFLPSDLISFTGSANDSEDGLISAALRWSSNLDGDLGMGSTVATTLSIGSHTVSAEVRDAAGEIGTNAITVNVTAGNTSPIADAGTDQVVTAGADVTLDGSSSNDPDGTIDDYDWQQTSGTTVALTGADTAMATFTAPAVTAMEILGFELTVTDNDGAMVTDSVDVTVNPAGSGSGAFQQVSGMVVMEAENFSEDIPPRHT